MGPAAASILVCVVFVCCVQCQRNRIVDSGEHLESLDPKGSRTWNQGWSSGDEDIPTQFHRRSVPVFRDLNHDGTPSKVQLRHRRRLRRQTFFAKNINTVEEPFSWNHRFTIGESNPTSLTKESAYSWQENTKRLKYTLEKDTKFHFLNPTGLRISIPANNVNMRIVDFRVKLNDEFRSNDGGHFALNSYKRGGEWIYDIPQIRVKQGDKIYYWMRLSLSKEAFDVIVKGIVDITLGNPHVASPNSEQIPFRPTTGAVLMQPQAYGGGVAPTLGTGTRGAFVWNHQFTINSTYSDGFTRDSANSWLQHAEFLKRFLQKHIEFQFLNPRGLIISVPDDNINIVDFRLKLNQEFWDNDGGHFAPSSYKRGGLWLYSIPQLQVKQGDKIYYWMRVKRGQDGFDAIVRGVMEITQGNPHTESTNNQLPSVSYHPTQTSHVVRPYRPISEQQPINGGQLPISSGLQPIGSGQPATGGGQPPVGVAQQPVVGPQAFSWDHKFVSVNLNTTSNEFTASLPDKTDEYLKKALERNIKFEFFNPTGLRTLISGDDNQFRILDFNIKLNEEFKSMEPGHFVANVGRMSDGRWSFYYPSLKLKQGDIIYYWMRVLYGTEMWLYAVKGQLEITLGDPHSGPNVIQTSTPPPRQQTFVGSVPTTSPPRPQSFAGTVPTTEGGGGAARWEHRYYINTTSNDGSPKKSANSLLEEAQLLKRLLEKEIVFKFLNPSGLSLSFSGEDKNFRILALNIKLNEEFRTLGPGDYVANITKMMDGRWSYYYPNLKVKQGDKVFYWMRVMLGKDLTDYIVRGELKLTQGNPHIGGPIPDIPPPVIWTQPPSRTTEANVPLSGGQPLPQSNNNQPPSQAIETKIAVPQNNYQSPNQVPQTQTFIPQNENQSPSQVSLTQVPVPQNNNQPSNQIPVTQTPVLVDNNQPLNPQADILNRWNGDQPANQFPQQPSSLPLSNDQFPQQPSPLPLSNEQFPQQPSPLPLTNNQFLPTQLPIPSPTPQSQPCDPSQSSPNAPCEVVVGYHFDEKGGHHTHRVTIGGKHPVQISVDVQVEKDGGDPSNINIKSR